MKTLILQDHNLNIDTILKSYPYTTVINNVEELQNNIDNNESNITFWFISNPSYFPLLYQIKEKNYKTMLIAKTSYSNINSILLDGTIFKLKANLIINEYLNTYQVIDPLGCLWYEGTNFKDALKSTINRINFLLKITRQSTIQEDEKIGALAWYFNQFKQDYKPLENIANILPNQDNFLNIIKTHAIQLTKETTHTETPFQILQNTSLRCIKSMPSFRYKKDIVFVSKRNIDHPFIEQNDFIPMIEKDNQIFYQGKYKPSVDSPIQLQLYKHLPNINYIIHTHCYIQNAPFTKKNYPCGAVEEINEILQAIQKYYPTLNETYYEINLIGHGAYALADTEDKLKNIKYIGRKIPEKIF